VQGWAGAHGYFRKGEFIRGIKWRGEQGPTGRVGSGEKLQNERLVDYWELVWEGGKAHENHHINVVGTGGTAFKVWNGGTGKLPIKKKMCRVG